MKSHFVLGAILVLLIGLAPTLFAAEHTAQTVPPMKSSEHHVSATATPSINSTSGTVKSVDAGEIMLDTGSKFSINSKTTILVKGEKGTSADVKAGAAVKVKHAGSAAVKIEVM